ncbi:MAG: CPBP family intramembrane glutamic endopeptidase [Bacteroidales bacterium]
MTEIITFFYQLEYDHASGIVLICFGMGFLAYFWLSVLIKNLLNGIFQNVEKETYYAYISQRIMGFLFLGIFPALTFYHIQKQSLVNYGINIQNLHISLIWILLLGSTIITINFFLAGNKTNLKYYPQIQLKNWSFSSFLINVITWILYLFSYELLFRGLLLFSLYHAYGLTIAIIVNTILYSLIHIPKGKRETLGAVPLGIILCLISIQTGSFFAAFAFHAIMAISNDYFAIKYNPAMKLNLKK